MKKDHCLKPNLLILIIIKEKTEGLNLVPSLILRHMVSIVQYPHVHSYSIYCIFLSFLTYRANIDTRCLYSRTIDLHHDNNLEHKKKAGTRLILKKNKKVFL